jgi:hypothetical protein
VAIRCGDDHTTTIFIPDFPWRASPPVVVGPMAIGACRRGRHLGREDWAGKGRFALHRSRVTGLNGSIPAGHGWAGEYVARCTRTRRTPVTSDRAKRYCFNADSPSP